MLLEGFWPTNNWKVNHPQFAEPSSPVLVDREDTILKPFCGLKNMKPTFKMTLYTPFRDLHNGDIILAWPLDLEVYLVWLGRTNNDVVKDEGNKHYKMVHVQWWMSSKKGTMNDVELYLDYW
jgi:hypothetical protein